MGGGACPCYENRSQTHTVIPAKAGIQRGEGRTPPFSSLLRGLRKAIVIPTAELAPYPDTGEESKIHALRQPSSPFAPFVTFVTFVDKSTP